ncbi:MULTISPECIES: Stk1 family PASTA domain-containing Ser/Thr kinase [unclassified Mumia]|uniref:Stk1 family PASTA domain-containing Ser/Thr kinase n=1 Tax=unclassified Mumia TaxID=2621872 RepID=UPI001FBBB5D2|nr:MULTISPECIES: Stk1 family PASTA domain-containing Ser/Thr kinase [unclassified Mumia]
MTTTDDEMLVGRVIDGRYHLRQVLARGGMGTVLLATDTRLDRTVAVKVMQNAAGGDQDFTTRLQAEARAAARLNHPNVVAVFDQGDDAGLLYLVMEYVPGHTLRDVISREAPLPPRRVLTLVEPLLLALSAAHDARIIHRDVKPENVLITPSGHVKVADFGLARAITARSQATTGVLIGSVSYLAPELVLNEGADARCDVYAVGAVMYEMLTGAKPHTGETPIQVAYQHVHADVPAPSTMVTGIPPYVDALVARATARDRDQRSADARVLLHQVRRVRSALEAGIVDDVELTQDLRLHRIVAAGSDDLLEASTPEAALATTVAGHDAYAGYDASDTIAATHVAAGPLVEPSPPYDAGYEATRTVTRDSSGIPTAPVDPARTRAAAGRQHRRGRRLLILALVVALVAAGLGWWFGVARYESAPDLVGLTLAQARTEGQQAGYTVDTGDEAYSETVARGSIVSTDPGPGGRILPDGTLTLTVSKGKERYPLPDLEGMSESEAESALTDIKAVIGQVDRKYSDSVDLGDVISMSLPVGRMIRPDTEVDLVVSKGRRPVDVVDYTGKSLKHAQAKLEKAGLEVKVERVHDDEVRKDEVMAQDPADGTAYKGDTVTLTVSDGPQPIEVPGVIGKNVDDATAILEAAGFKVKVEKERIHFGSNLVSRQSPGGGDEAPPGSTIVLRIV